MEVKKRIVHALTILSFPLQLAYFAYFYTRSTKGFAVLIVVSIAAHFLYYKRAIKEGNAQHKMHFLYYEIAVAVLQSFMAFSYPIAFANFAFWIMTIPLVVQVATCIVMCALDDKSESDGLPFHNEVINDKEDDQFKKKVTFYDFPIVHKIDDFN